ncbi:hypothetical protein Ancab_021603 [Ancistrocladus abbreviatus]
MKTGINKSAFLTELWPLLLFVWNGYGCRRRMADYGPFPVDSPVERGYKLLLVKLMRLKDDFIRGVSSSGAWAAFGGGGFNFGSAYRMLMGTGTTCHCLPSLAGQRCYGGWGMLDGAGDSSRRWTGLTKSGEEEQIKGIGHREVKEMGCSGYCMLVAEAGQELEEGMDAEACEGDVEGGFGLLVARHSLEGVQALKILCDEGKPHAMPTAGNVDEL